MFPNSYSPWQYDSQGSRWYCYYTYRAQGGGSKSQAVLCYPGDSPFRGHYYFVKPVPGPDLLWGRCVHQSNPSYDPNVMKWQHHNDNNQPWQNYPQPGYCPTPGDGVDPINEIPDPPLSFVPAPPL